jgi:enolase
MAKIAEIKATEILNSKGNPTIEAIAILDDGSIGIADVPSGTSTGTYEAFELKDMDPKRYLGNGMLKAIENIEKLISPKLVGMDAGVQSEVDKAMIELDGTENKSKLGANAILAVSMSVTKAAAISAGVPLYRYIR